MPIAPVLPGAQVRLVCRSHGTSELTRLVWYNNGFPVDTTYAIVGDHIVNDYVVDTSSGADVSLECRLEFPPTGLQISELAVIRVRGMLPPDADTLFVKLELCAVLFPSRYERPTDSAVP